MAQERSIWGGKGLFCEQKSRKIEKNRGKLQVVFADSKDGYSQQSGFEVGKITPFIILGLKRAAGVSRSGAGREVHCPNETRIKLRRTGDLNSL